jgi:hypothetical protein
MTTGCAGAMPACCQCLFYATTLDATLGQPCNGKGDDSGGTVTPIVVVVGEEVAVVVVVLRQQQ